MIGLDTNVLLRLLLDDDAEQNAVVRQELEAAAIAGAGIFVNDIVLAEAVWTLSRSYGTSKQDLLTALRALTETTGFRFENTTNLARAVQLFEKAGADFADCLIVAKNAALGCTATVTFDKAMRTLPGARILSTT